MTDHLAQIREGGIAVAGRKLYRVMEYAVNALWSVPAVLIIRALRRIYPVHFGEMISYRIGHFVVDSSIYLARESLTGSSRSRNLFWIGKTTANAQWAAMVRRQLPIRDWVWYLILFDRLLPGRRAAGLPSTHGSRDVEGVLALSSKRYQFTPAESRAAKAWFKKKGWVETQPFVCLLARDSAYLKRSSLAAGVDWSYHDYRDSKISDYAESVRFLIDRGYWVVRMGKVADDRLPLEHPRLIDYPFLTDQDDLVDVWLSANCHLFLSTGTGIDLIPVVYGRPAVFVNYLPIRNILSYGATLTSAKELRWAESGVRLTLREHIQHDYFESGRYRAAGIKIIDQAPQDIRDIVREADDRIAGNWVDSRSDISRRERFWSILREWPRYSEFHGAVHPRAMPSTVWLRSMGEAFLQ